MMVMNKLELPLGAYRNVENEPGGLPPLGCLYEPESIS